MTLAMNLRSTLLLLFVSLACFGCVKLSNDAPEHSKTNSVWTMDLIRTLPGQQQNYINSIKSNWASARQLADERGAVLSYNAFSAEPDSSRGWDVVLMTEYADSISWEKREEIFQDIFNSDEFVAVEPAAPSAEMRAFFAGGVVLSQFVDK